MNFISETNAEYVASPCKCKDNCKSYADLLVDEGCKDDDNKIDPYLLLSIMMQESNCVPSSINQNLNSNNKVSSFDCGLMQVNTKSQEDCNKLIQNPAYSIERAVNLLKDKFGGECTFTGGKYENGNFECDASTLIMNSGCTRSVKYSGWASKIRGYNGWGA
ncbi:lytic transglycosylase domain-containing protein, partial [Candidatus Woesearchaeota archaeon]|nr:lytic transglycosylase domain-containing protein [Candidatus Woesearchaeota archaeon]